MGTGFAIAPLRHEFDGAPHITSGMAYTLDPETGKINVGCRRLSLRNGREVMLELDTLRRHGVLCCNRDGQYFLGPSKKGVTTVVDSEIRH